MTMFSSFWMANAGAAAFSVDNSAVFNDDDSQYLNRTFGSDGNRKTMTFSWWMKRGNLGISDCRIFTARDSNDDQINFADSSSHDRLDVFFDGTSSGRLTTTQVFRDPHAWYHCVVAIDTTQSTAGDRVQIYVNGDRVTSFDTETQPSQNQQLNGFNNNNVHAIGSRAWSSPGGFYDGYLSEFVFVDGSQLGPTSFGETDSNGVWRPINVSGLTFGTNGFYLNFAASGSDLGDDASGNSNDFTNNNSVTQTTDSPTTNYAVLSPLTHQTNGDLSKGNTQTTTGSADQGLSFATFPVTTGQKVYIEALCSGATSTMTGCVKATSAVVQDPTSDFDALESADGGAGRLLHVSSGDVFNSDGNTSASNYAPNDSVPVRHMIALDLVNDKIYWGDAGVGASGWSDGSGSFNQSFDNAVGVDLTANLDWFFAFRPFTGTIEVNFGATAFTVSPPTGYSSGYSAAIENANRETALTIEDGSAYFQTTLYTGNGASSHEINQSGENSTFAPDLVWTKGLTVTEHRISDVIRGATKVFFTDTSLGNSVSTTETSSVLSFDSDGFTVGSGGGINGSGQAKLAWQWKAGDSNTSVSASGSGDDAICACTHRANQTAGFSLVKYTGRNSDISNGQHSLVTHGLGAKPDAVWIKSIDDTQNWVIMLADSNFGNDAFVSFNSTDDLNGSDFVGYFGGDSTSTHFVVGNDNKVNKNGDEYMAYVFKTIPGFSKFGLFEGNGNANGPFIELGFKPSWILVKSIDANSRPWVIHDSARNPNNVTDLNLVVNDTSASTSSNLWDFLSNGFKIRDSLAGDNENNKTHLYMAFAENPFAGTTPVTAR